MLDCTVPMTSRNKSHDMKQNSPTLDVLKFPLPRVAVLLASYNGINYIATQIQSICSQNDVDIMLFVSDDMSTDGTWEYLNSIVSCRIKLLPRTERYGTASRNFFRLLRDVDLTEYDYIAFSDQDDIWLTDRLFNALNAIKTNKADAFSSNVEAFWPDGAHCIVIKNQPQCKWDHFFESAGPGCTFVLGRRLALEVQETLRINKNNTNDIDLHDWFIYCYARNHEYCWWIDNYPGVRYRQHEENVIGANAGWRSALERMRMIRNGWYFRQVLLIADLCGGLNTWPIVRLLRYSWTDRIVLAFSAHHLRRCWRDRIALFIMFIVPIKTTPSKLKGVGGK